MKPFRMGDVVSIKSKSGLCQRHIVAKVEFTQDGKSFEYATDLGAWYDHEDMTLVEKCSKASLKELFKALQAEYNEE